MVLNDLPSAQISKNFEHFWSLGNFWSKNRFSPPTGRAPCATLSIGRSISGKVCIFGFVMQKYTFSVKIKKFHQVLSLQKVKKQAKNDFLPPF
jgi:hypothetical protein